MKNQEIRGKESEGRSQRSEIKSRRSGFTIVEILLALSISTLVFFAMATVLSRCFALWRDSIAHWELAQQAKQTRVRLLHNTFLEGNGLLSANYIKTRSSRIDFDLLEDPNRYRLYAGYTTSENYPAYFWKPSSFPSAERYFWLTKTSHRNSRSGSRVSPSVSMNYFTPTLNRDLLTMKYTLKKEIGGKTYEQKQTVTAHLINL